MSYPSFQLEYVFVDNTFQSQALTPNSRTGWQHLSCDYEGLSSLDLFGTITRSRTKRGHARRNLHLHTAATWKTSPQVQSNLLGVADRYRSGPYAQETHGTEGSRTGTEIWGVRVCGRVMERGLTPGLYERQTELLNETSKLTLVTWFSSSSST